jgi:O-antigen ligase
VKLDKVNYWFTASLTLAAIVFLYLLYQQEFAYLVLFILGLTAIIAVPYLFQNTRHGLYILILLIPLSIDLTLSGGLKISVPSEILTLLILLFVSLKWISGLKLKLEIFKHPISVLLLLDFIWAVMATLFSEIQEVSIKRVIIKGLFLGVYYFVILQFFEKSKHLNLIYWLYGIGIILPIISATYTHSILGFNQGASILVSQPFYDDHTIYGACIAFIIPFFVLKIKSPALTKVPVILFLFILFMGVVLSYSRAAWISLFVALLFYIIIKFKPKPYLIFITLTIGIITLFGSFDSIYSSLSRSKVKYDNNVSTHLTSVTNLQNDASNLERINRWIAAYKMFEDRPITGFGPGTYQFVYDRFQATEHMTRISTHNGNKGNSHSEYMTYLSENGIVGFLIFILLIFYSVYTAIILLYANIPKEYEYLVYASILGLITFYIHGLFNSFIESEKMAILFLSSLAILVHIDLKNRHNKLILK